MTTTTAVVRPGARAADPPRAGGRTRRRPSRQWRIQERWAWLFVALPMLLFAIFVLIPAGMALVLSFSNYSIIGDTGWVGIDNYTKLFLDPYFFIALRNTAWYTLMFVPLGLIVAISTALLLNRNVRVAGLFRTLFYIPVVSSTVATATIWYWLLNPQFGMLNVALGWFGIDGPAWLYDSAWAMPAIVLMSVWAGFGTNMMIYLGGLQGIPPQLYESARTDGASGWQQFRFITMPSLSRTTFLVSTLLVIGAFQVFDQAYVLTKGGPGNSTITLVYYIYTQGFGNLEMGYASAISFVLFAIIAVFALINVRITGRDNT
ncbi:binding-protein-dependent transport systems inner membrane component [Beutenbergia cavernae DSM 12333]|uniref:Binding-protein-dependent transport systems inner membrane component n=1 Tax=Beutenbergia cavernae (strain ATCC BAA-8 / DSM 12333 / CCUG 43141 / JCM 11478 / NBRC 16432 / NCIMB 13614 / HKI 0122) TaxID=471853 RepID=C5C591_BEUC1|nr:sugar ABC transporter permease [Beutenbergia cavernae]ACQ82231.1 binding-protein-dependent transport systems inner membrane component [Beutenbergia cavernae DSM 12333]